MKFILILSNSMRKKHLATIIGEHQSEDFKNRIILLLLYSQVSNRRTPLPCLLILRELFTQDILFHTPFNKFQKMF